MFKALGYENAARGGGALGARLGPIMAKLGWKSTRRADANGQQRRCFEKEPTVKEGCDAPPPKTFLVLSQGSTAKVFKAGTTVK